MSKITIIRGDSRAINLTFVQSDGVTPFNLTGCTVYFTANSSSSPVDDSSAAIQKSTTSHTSAVGGTSSIQLTSSDTNITPGTYFYDVQVKDGSSNITSLKQDKLIISPDITRRTS